MERFWERVREYANKKVREHYMNRVRHDRQCERCNTWTSEVGGCAKIEVYDYRELMTCKKCKHVSVWDCRGMIPILVPDESLKNDD